MATNHDNHSHHSETRSTQANGGDQPRLRRVREIVRFARELPQSVQTQFKAHPAATVATIAGVSFVFGALAGSRLGRIAMAAAFPLVLKRVLEGEVGEEIARYVRGLVGANGGAHNANA